MVHTPKDSFYLNKKSNRVISIWKLNCIQNVRSCVESLKKKNQHNFICPIPVLKIVYRNIKQRPKEGKKKIGYFNQSRPKCEHSVLKKNLCVRMYWKRRHMQKILHTIFFFFLFAQCESTSSEKVIYLCVVVSLSRMQSDMFDVRLKYIHFSHRWNKTHCEWYIDRSF